MEKTLFTLRPQLVVAIIPSLILALFIGGFIGTIIGIPLRSIGVGVVIGFLLAIIFLILHFMNLNSKRYIFYQNKAEFYEGFLNITQRTVDYKKVTDCILIKTVWDRMFNTGTIRLLTAGHQEVHGHYGYGGLVMQYIENPNQVYQKVQELLGIEKNR